MGNLYDVDGTTGSIVTAGSITAAGGIISTSTTTGFLPPRLTTVQRNLIVAPNLVTGLQIFNTTTVQDEFYNGTAWIAVGAGTGIPGGSNGQVQYNDAGVFGGLSIGVASTPIFNNAGILNINLNTPLQIVSGTLNLSIDNLTLDSSGAGGSLEIATGGITNTQISASAAISASKLVAAGSTTQIQYNNGGAFTGSSDLTWNDSTATFTIFKTGVTSILTIGDLTQSGLINLIGDGAVRFGDTVSGNYIQLQAPAHVTGGNYTVRLPAIQGGVSTFLQNDGSGNLSWAISGGVTSIHADSNVAITGTIQFVSGTNVTLTQVGNAITVNVPSVTPSLTTNHIFVGNVSNVATDVAMSGDATIVASGALTFATVNTNTGSFGSSTSIPTFTVNGKGLITAASGNVVVAPAGTLSGTTINSTVVSSSLTSVGTITSGTWTGTTIAVANGGTGTSTPSLIAGTNITSITGTWPNQTINAATQVTSPGGVSGNIQWNNGGIFAGTTGIITDGTNLTITTGNLTLDIGDLAVVGLIQGNIAEVAAVLLMDADSQIKLTGESGDTITIKYPGISGSYSLFMPDSQGTGVLANDGSGNLSWAAVSGSTVITVTTTFTAATANVILADGTGGAFTVTLPSATSSTNIEYTIKKIDSSANVITIKGNSSDNIDGSNTQLLNSQYQSLTVVCDGTQWFVI